VLVATIVGSSLAFIDGTVVNVALPVLQEDLGASMAGAQWVIEAYVLLLAAFTLPGGALADRFGRRRVFAAGTAIFALTSVWCGLAPSIGHLVAGRAAQGVGAALLVPASLAIIGASFAPERRGRAIGTWSAFSAMTMAVGPVLGGWLVEHASWRAVFFINLPLATVVIGVLFWRVPESRREADGEGSDWFGVALVALGLGAVVYGLIESSDLGLGDPVVVAALAAGAVLLAAFVTVEARGPSPMMPLGLFASRAFTGANLLTLLLYGALSGALFFFPFNLLQVQGYSASETGLALLPFPVFVFLLSRWSGELADRVGAALPLVVGPAVAAAGFGLLAVPWIGGSYWVSFFPGVAVLGIGMGVTAAPLTTAVLGAVPDDDSGIASGVNNAVSRVAGLLAIALLGVVMVAVYSGSLEARLKAAGVGDAAVLELLASRNRLAASEPPTGLGTEAQAAVRGAVGAAFVTGFRRVMVLCAGLALAAALAAAATLRRPAAETHAGPAG